MICAKMIEPQDTVVEYYPERRRSSSSAIAFYVLVAPIFVVMVVSAFSRALAWPAGIAVAAYMLYRKRRARVPFRVLEVKDGQLTITEGRGTELLRAPIDEISNVRLDTKSVEKVEENLSSGVPDVRFIDSRVGPSIDNARIEVCVGTDVFLLNDEYTSHIDASEWFSKIRRMLRKNGWIPWDERSSSNELTNSA